MKEGNTIPISTRPGEVGVGAELGSYRLEALLGKGAMGRVFRARHLKLGREVAIKILNPEYATRADVVRRFFREAQVVNQIGHEHIVDVTDLVEFSGGAFLVMELLEGESLRQVIRRKRRKWPTVHTAVEIMAQVCDALDAAHQHDVVHRDLKPDNIFIMKRNGREFVKVLDFGVAKLKEPDTESTANGMILGTPLYMSPEQASGKPVDRAADIWAAGVVLYQLLSGAAPFRGENFAQLVEKLRDDPVLPLPAKTPRGEPIPPELGGVVMRCLEKRPSDRFRSMGALAEALRSAAKGVVLTRGDRRLFVLAALVLVAGGVTAAVRHSFSRRPVPPRSVLSVGVVSAGETGGVTAGGVSPSSTPFVNGTSTAEANTMPPAATPSTSHSTLDPTEVSVPVRPFNPEAQPSRIAAAAPRRHSEKVEIELYSKPSGAKVVRLDTGEVLGKTPTRVRVPKRSGEIAVRFTLRGYQSITASVDLATGGSAAVAMRKVETKVKPKKHRTKPRYHRSSSRPGR